MKRWTNGLPGATMRLGAKMAQRGLSASQPRMRADTHVGPELNAPLQRPDTLMQLSRSPISEVRLATRGRAIHLAQLRPTETSAIWPLLGVKQTISRVGRTVLLEDVREDKYPKRVDAYVTIPDGRDLADGGQRQSSCADQAR